MINLLPFEDKLAVKKEYRRRLIVVVGILIFSIFCSAIILSVPSYFLLSSLEKSLAIQTSVLKEISAKNETEKIESSIADLNEKLTTLTSNEKRQMSFLLKGVLDIRPAAVKISAIYYAEEKGKELLSIEGEAMTRNSFLLFLDNLEKIEGIKNVSSPPSNILKEENVSFRLTAELFPLINQQ